MNRRLNPLPLAVPVFALHTFVGDHLDNIAGLNFSSKLKEGRVLDPMKPVLLRTALPMLLVALVLQSSTVERGGRAAGGEPK